MAKAAAWVIYRSGSNVYVRPFGSEAEAKAWAAEHGKAYRGVHVVTTKADYNRAYVAEHRKAGNLSAAEARRLKR